MGVYISDLEIPSKGKGVVVILCSSGAVYSGGQKVGTAVHVPPHGALIDRDALAEDGWVLTKQVMRMGGYAIHELPLKNPTIPVIVPAEEGET